MNTVTGYALKALAKRYDAHDRLVKQSVLVEDSRFINGSGDLVERISQELGETAHCEPIVMDMLSFYDMRNAGYHFGERVKYI